MNDSENQEQAQKCAAFLHQDHPQKQPTDLSVEVKAEETTPTSFRFEDTSDGGIRLTDHRQNQLSLTPEETYSLWQWLSAHDDFFQGKHLEIHLYQEDLEHLDDLKAVIPEIHERGPILKVLDAKWETVSERALQILKEFQIEYLIHPMLEENDTYEQG
jgi:hypothetical protein